ncbi:hypothetical protein GCM10028857_23040 [Salinarchaeum chitinilyticum]
MIDLPTTRSGWSSIWRAIRRTLTTPGLLPLALLVAVLVATATSISRRLPFVADVLAGDLSIGAKAEFLLLYLPFVGGLPASVADVAGLVVAVVAGVTVAVLFGEAIVPDRGSTDPDRRDAGVVVGVLAVVAAAFGPAVLAGLAGFAGEDGGLTALPLRGLELSVLAVPAMLLAMHLVVEESA